MNEITPVRINLTPTRNHRVKSHYGIYNYFKHYNKNAVHDKVLQPLYRKILRNINEELQKKVATIPYDLRLPKRMGILKVRKYYPEFHINTDGSIKNKMAVDFKSTIELWKNDEDAFKNRIRLYYENEHSDGFIFKVKYDKGSAKYKNKSVYMWKVNRALKTILKTNIYNKQIDAFLI